MATTQDAAGRRIALEQIRVPDNVRALDDSHVQALAGSIKLQGMRSSSLPAFTASPPRVRSV